MDIKEKIKAFPEVPGVYLMKDSNGNIIYVGKSKNLKKRVGQYFSNKKQEWSKIIKLVQGIRDIEYIVTDTEFDALLLECRLIKELKPMYNSQMKNHLEYCYIRITVEEEFPRIMASEDRIEGEKLFFGPYTSLKNVERGVKALSDYYGLRNCSGENIKGSISGCLSYQLNQCLAPCIKRTSKEDYRAVVDEAVSFLMGENEIIICVLEKRMNEVAEKMDFLKAAKIRDDIFSLRHIAYRERTIQFSKDQRRLIVIEPMEENKVKLFLILDSNILFSMIYNIALNQPLDIKKEISSLVQEYFVKQEIRELKLNKEQIDQAQIVYSYLRNRKNNCEYASLPRGYFAPYKEDKIFKVLDKFNLLNARDNL